MCQKGDNGVPIYKADPKVKKEMNDKEEAVECDSYYSLYGAEPGEDTY